MIRLNGNVYHAEHFPDGTQLLKVDESVWEDGKVECIWQYEKEEELVTIFFLTKHLQEKGAEVSLIMPYIPNARMDRVKKDSEVFTLKYFAQLINSLNFTKVRVLDPHSNVSTALIDRLVNDSPKAYIAKVMDRIKEQVGDFVLYFPDEGASKRYSELFQCPYCYGMKKRNWEDGTILGIDVVDNGIDLKGKHILMIDDIIAYGGSLYYSAKRLKELGVGKLFAYATHVEKSVLHPEKGKLLQSGLVEQIYTTDSLFLEQHEKITVLQVK